MRKTNSMRVVLDTNVFLVSLVPHFKYYWVFDAIIQEKYEIIISNDILAEYEEKIIEKFNLELAEAKLNFLPLLPNVHLVNPYYNWSLIPKDPDDNKFVDAAVSGNADFIVSNDKHFRILKEVKFPKLEVLTVSRFRSILVERGIL